MVANATAMKLAALSTVNNRIQLDDVRKYRRARSNEDKGAVPNPPMSPTMNVSQIPNANFVMTNELGQVLTPQQATALQAQQLAAMNARRSRPNSPGFLGSDISANMNYASPQNNGFLAAFNNGGANSLVNGMSGMSLGPIRRRPRRPCRGLHLGPLGNEPWPVAAWPPWELEAARRPDGPEPAARHSRLAAQSAPPQIHGQSERT